MRIKQITFFSLAIMFLSCDDSNYIRTYYLPKEKINKINPQTIKKRTGTSGLIWEKPDSWIPSEGSSMRLASFAIPYSGGTGDLSVIQLSGTGGGIESNVNRWRQQLDLESHSLIRIENYITNKTVGIMPVHVFGNPCDIDGIKGIADRYNLKVIYDAAHAIGSEYGGKSILSYGDISALSTHATKLLNSGEGGGCVAKNKTITDRLRSIRFFGHNKHKSDILFDGLNGKLTELQSALGIVNLKYLDEVIADRKIKYKYYLMELEF